MMGCGMGNLSWRTVITLRGSIMTYALPLVTVWAAGLQNT
ncbi:hypothetical protein AO364_1180 [Moraxella catarrhalis]|nr:hypothetical protein AO364_1180 [Moraxella catarrhalis]